MVIYSIQRIYLNNPYQCIQEHITIKLINQFQILLGQNKKHNLKHFFNLKFHNFINCIIYYNSYLMESIVPKCINNNTCTNVCNVKICKAMPFMCNDEQCLCYSQHQKCATNIRWKIIKQSFSNKIKQSSTKLTDAYFTQIDDLYKSILKQIEKSSTQIKNISDNFGLSKLEREVYQKLKQKKFGELTGEMINKVQVDLMTGKKQFQVRIIEKQKKQIEKQTNILIQMLQGLTKQSVIKEQQIKSNSPIKQSITSFKLDSKITQDVGTLSSFFTKKIVSMNLLYRASENNFQVSKFWDKCNGKKDTITILKTQFGNVIGGYTPLAWKSMSNGKWQWGADNSMQSFIFSLTNKHKLKLIQGKQDKAIYHSSYWGPCFGGNNIRILDKANQSNNIGNPGDIYNNNNEYLYDTQQSYKKWSGQSNGFQFKILQWQVYSLVFIT